MQDALTNFYFYKIILVPQSRGNIILDLKMTRKKLEQGLDVSSITFNEIGEMIVLDDELLTLISGGTDYAAKPKPAPQPTPQPAPPIGSGNNAICGVNFNCPGNPTTPPPPKQMQ